MAVYIEFKIAVVREQNQRVHRWKAFVPWYTNTEVDIVTYSIVSMEAAITNLVLFGCEVRLDLSWE